ncbi:NAD(P)/FAD-dependent oxidoreductase [Flavobacteriaceae sp. LMIT009]
MEEKAIIIGAGPAGLTAAYELVTRTNIKPIILERSFEIGGISRTVVHNGNRMDIGGHRFFSKSKLVMDWWQNILPIQGHPAKDELRDFIIPNENGPDPEKTDHVMLIRKRVSRIFFLRKFFDYPISINWKTISALGPIKLIKIGWTYFCIKLFPVKDEISLEDFFINRFGKELYETFFKDYTEKVWGVPCSKISSEWGAQRIKGLSITKAIQHAVKSIFTKPKNVAQSDTETSLIEQFMYPKLGPGHLWETVAKIVIDKGGEIVFGANVNELKIHDNTLEEVVYLDLKTNNSVSVKGAYVFSSMPVKHLIRAFQENVSKPLKEISEGLQYRDFITVGLLTNKLRLNDPKNEKLISDNWIYIQENDVKLGRLQIFNNWSPYLVKDETKVWLGLEYFCNKGDELWNRSDESFIKLAINELGKLEIIDEKDVLDSVMIRVPKAYPAYFGTYDRFEEIRKFTDTFSNLFLIGRNGMHKYNNQDHSMLTAIAAVNNIIAGQSSKDNIWSINVEKDYHEEK